MRHSTGGGRIDMADPRTSSSCHITVRRNQQLRTSRWPRGGSGGSPLPTPVGFSSARGWFQTTRIQTKLYLAFRVLEAGFRQRGCRTKLYLAFCVLEADCAMAFRGLEADCSGMTPVGISRARGWVQTTRIQDIVVPCVLGARG